MVAHGLSIGPLARKLKLAAEDSNGLLIVGASRFSLELAQMLRRLQQQVRITDGVWAHLKDARMAGVPIHYGEILSAESDHTLDVQDLSHLLSATENDFYNALVCKAKGRQFGHHKAFQLAAHSAADQEFKRMSIDMRGYFAFGPSASFALLHSRLAEGWTIQSTGISKSHDWEALKTRLDEAAPDWLLLGGITPKGAFRLYSKEQRFRLEPNWTAIYFAPPTIRAPKSNSSKSSESDEAGPGGGLDGAT
ncbi:MAG: NAD-binding protein [Lautropia sp.]